MTDNTEIDWDREPRHGRCERCYWQARHESPLLRGDTWTPTDEQKAERVRIHLATPPATHRYSPPCRCSYGNCWNEYLCAACAATVEEPRYVEALGDGDDD